MILLFKLLWYALAYLLGSIPFGLVVGRVFCKIDIRQAGSGNVGATNVARLCGTKWGVLTLLLDAAKGAVPVALVLYVLPHYWATLFPVKAATDMFVDNWAATGTATPSAIITTLAASGKTAVILAKAGLATSGMAAFTALAALLGHIYSFFLNFRGGKAVATTVGIYLVLLPIHLIIAAILCIVVIKRWGFVSLGSITLVSAMPILLVFSGMFTRNFDYFLLSVCIAVLVVYSHRGNLMRLMEGEEKPWRKRNEPETETTPAPASADSAAPREETSPSPAPQTSDTAKTVDAGPICPPPEDNPTRGL